MLLRLVFTTSTALFLVMLIAGEETDGLDRTLAVAAPPATHAGTDTPSIAEISRIDAEQSDPVPVAIITPVQRSRMPGPALRPAPEHRSTAAPGAPVGTVWEVSASRLNVRAGPSTANGVVGQVSRGDLVHVMSDGGAGWVQIRIAGSETEGWVAKRLLRPAD